VGVFLFAHARYLASLTFDMVRVSAIVPQGHDQGQATGLANVSGDPQGHTFVLESEEGYPPRLQRFDAQDSPKTLVYKAERPGRDLKDAVDVDCDAKGQVYVLLKDGRVQILDNNLKYLRTLQTGIADAAAASVDSAGRVFVADEPENKVVYFDADGRRAGEFGGPADGGFSLNMPARLRVTPDDEILVVENSPLGMEARIFTKDFKLRKSFLVDKQPGSQWAKLGVNSQDKAFFNDSMAYPGNAISCWDLATGKYFGAAQGTKDGVAFINPGCIGADRFSPNVYVHTVPGLITCVLPPPDSGDGQ
jgi:DNA-binding beta-propeller fold protein YncE